MMKKKEGIVGHTVSEIHRTGLCPQKSYVGTTVHRRNSNNGVSLSEWPFRKPWWRSISSAPNAGTRATACRFSNGAQWRYSIPRSAPGNTHRRSKEGADNLIASSVSSVRYLRFRASSGGPHDHQQPQSAPTAVAVMSTGLPRERPNASSTNVRIKVQRR